MNAVLAIAATSIHRMVRDRSNIFFVFIFPLMLVLLIGLAFGGGIESVVGVVVVDEGSGERVVDVLAEQDLELDSYSSAEALRADVARGTVDAGVVVRRGGEGRTVVEYVAGPGAAAALLRTTVDAAVAEAGNTSRAVIMVVDRSDLEPDGADALVRGVSGMIPGVGVEVRQAGETAFEGFDELGVFGFGAVGQLLLFVFLTSLTGSAALIETRQLGVARRMLAAPVRPSQVLAGQALGHVAIAVIQAVYIVAGTALIFGVDWGNLWATAVVLLVFCLVSAAVGMVLGALMSNDAQAGGVGILVGLGAAALGGSMLPLELFSETMRRVAHLTPHAWAQDAFADLLRRGGTLTDVLPELGVLVGMAAVGLVVGAWALHRSTVRA